VPYHAGLLSVELKRGEAPLSKNHPLSFGLKERGIIKRDGVDKEGVNSI
jgi:hypothetical protein